jgi:hypothetical protein
MFESTSVTQSHMEKWKHDIIARKPPFKELSKRHQVLLHGTLYHKLDVVRRIEGGTLTRADAARELGCSQSAIYKLMRSKDNILAFCSANPGGIIHQKAKYPKYQQLEHEIARWVDGINGLFSQLHFGVGMRMIQHYAKQAAERMGLKDFDAESGGWFSRFCQRRLINRINLHGSGGDVNLADHEGAIRTLKETLSGFECRDIYNMDETGLFYRCRTSNCLP